jgi:hypothetical protein
MVVHHQPKLGANARTRFFVLYSVFKEHRSLERPLLCADAVITVGPQAVPPRSARSCRTAVWGELSTYLPTVAVSNTWSDHTAVG